MPTRNQILIQFPRPSSFGFGSSDSTSLRGVYRQSPIYTLTDEQIRRSFDSPAELDTNSGELNDGPNGDFGTTNRYYAGSLDFSTVPVGGGGLPASPFGPNIAVSTDENDAFNVSAVPADGVALTDGARAHGTGGFGVGDGLESPSVTTPRIVRRSLSVLLTPGTSFVRS